jgi:hypothetical protein
MLSFDEFQTYIRDNIKSHLPEEFADAVVSLNTVTKNNGKVLNAITIRTEDCNITPNIYLEAFYENYKAGMELDVVLERIKDIELEHMEPSRDIIDVAKKFTDPEFAKSHVVVALVNAEQNKMLLSQAPHTMKEDLAIIYKVMVGRDADSTATITVKNEHMAQWGLSVDELHACAIENSKTMLPATVRDMNSVLTSMMGAEFTDEIPYVAENSFMYIISNDQNLNGAAAILYSDALEKLSEKVGTDLYVLPSSIHELIAVSTEMGTPESMAEMVREVNSTQVSVEERLSDHVYIYNAHEKTLSLADVKAEDLNLAMVSENNQSYEAAKTEAARPRHHR